MVRITRDPEAESESETEASERESSDEEEEVIDGRQEEIPLDPLGPLDLLDDSASSPRTPEQLHSDEESALEERTTTTTDILSTVVDIGVTNILNIRFLLDRYSKLQNSVNYRPIISEGLSKFVSELEDKAAPISGTFAGARTPADNWMPIRNNRRMDRDTTATENLTSLFQTMESKQYDDEDDSTKEKSNGLGEKQQLAASAAEAEASLLSNPELTDGELSDVSESQLSPDLSTDRQWTNILSRDTLKHLAGESALKEPSEICEEPGEAIALSASLASNSRHGYAARQLDDDRLFTLETNVLDPVPSTSSAEYISSPTTERHRTKLENRQRAQLQRTDQPFGGMRERYITVPTEKIGRIVGKGGNRIREIEYESGAKIKIGDRKSKNPFTKIILIGTDAQISAATDEIGLIARNFKPAEPGETATVAVSNFNETELRHLLLNIKNQVSEGEKSSR